jgi:hypothetical protein
MADLSVSTTKVKEELDEEMYNRWAVVLTGLRFEVLGRTPSGVLTNNANVQ